MRDINLEQERFSRTQNLVNQVLDDSLDKLKKQMNMHKQSNQEMLSISKDYASEDVRAELSQSLQVFQQETAANERLTNKVNVLRRMKDQPYFGRFDVEEDQESFYVGISNFMDPETLDLLVYDWRAPVSSLFYEQDYGSKTYETPEGQAQMTLTLKRHFYSNSKGLTKYYDMDATPADHFLIEVLSENKQDHLTPIVQSIQKQQNEIIRGQEVDLLNVQGVPGSGKSIIALHRMAYLLYHSRGNYKHDNMVILSPNDGFKTYIENVLPALGESMNLQYTMTDLLEATLGPLRQTREAYLNDVLAGKKRVDGFKNSKGHYVLLQRWLKYYIKNVHPIEDFYFENELILSKHDIREELIKYACNKPLELVLNRFRDKLNTLLEYPMKVKFMALEDQVKKHNLEPEALKQRLKKLKRHFFQKINHFNNRVLHMNYYRIFRSMYDHPKVIKDLGRDLNIPKGFFSRNFHHDDYYAQMVLKLWINEERRYKQVQYLLVDESQDYDYMAYQIMKALFFNAKFTLVGDVDQSLVKKEDAFFDMAQDVFQPASVENISLETCYRSTANIVDLAKTYLDSPIQHVGRQGQAPQILESDPDRVRQDLDTLIKSHRAKYDKGLVVITGTQDQTDDLEAFLKDDYKVSQNQNEDLYKKDLVILPIFQAKGFEFDHVVYMRQGVSDHQQAYVDYTAVTRAKHTVTVVNMIK